MLKGQDRARGPKLVQPAGTNIGSNRHDATEEPSRVRTMDLSDVRSDGKTDGHAPSLGAVGGRFAKPLIQADESGSCRYIGNSWAFLAQFPLVGLFRSTSCGFVDATA